MDRRRLKERGVYSHNCNKLNKNNILLVKISREFKIAEYPLHPGVYLGVVVYQVIYGIFFINRTPALLDIA